MTELTCQQCQEVAAEVALDVLPCHERAAALTHLEGCSTCQDAVSALTATADRLVELLPAAEPPAGFEQRVISALVPPAPRARRWWTPAAVAAALAAIALGAGGWVLGHSNTPTRTAAPISERTVMYAPLTTAQHQIGHAYVYPGTPSWIYLSVDSGTTSNTVNCEVVRQDGSAVRVGSFPVTRGHAAWGGPAPVDRGTVVTARLTDGHGATLATAHFGYPPHSSHHRHSQHPR